MDVLVAVWREAGRHIEISESAERIAALLAPELPIDAIVVRRLDLARRRLTTVGVGTCRDGASRPDAPRTECSPEEMDMLLAWFAEDRVRRGRTPGRDAVLDLAVPDGMSGDAIAGALTEEDGPAGVVVLHGKRGALTQAHEPLARSLCEPLAVALGNDHRFHELAKLREAVEAENRALLSRLERHDIADSVVGADSGLRTVMERIAQVAPTDAPVLILGETGSGKEVVARTIHARSRRAHGPIVRVNCGAIPTELVDSELFGHERGSFTGAVAARQGWFERASGGTLFLDEVGELPRAAQVRLLRALSEGTIERVGGQRAIEVDVRIVAATHRELEAMVASGGFRQDLWYRISVFPIRLPPLRERPGDIPALAAHFAWRAGKRLGGAPLAPSSADVDLLVRYEWPGNVRELAAVIERAAILGDGRRLDVGGALGVHSAAMSSGSRSDETSSAPQTLDAAMRDHIARALRFTHGRIEGRGGAADVLGINPHTLRSRMRKLGLDWRTFR